jgi:hypothetical protein
MRSLDQESLIDGVLSGIRDIDAMTEELSTAQLQVDERLNVYRNVIQNAIATLGGK